MEFPRMVRIRQKAPVKEENNVYEAVRSAIAKLDREILDLRGKKVGITAGSRGIHAIGNILRAVVDFINEAHGIPVLIPSMGTHGGLTVERQINLLSDLGITEESVGAPIVKCIDTTLIGQTQDGIPVYCNTEATRVDRLVLVNRIKPHTDFSGARESGICKMMTIGLGSQKGAETAHSYALLRGHEMVIRDVAAFMLQKLPISFAVGILENWKGTTSEIETMLPWEILEKEKELLSRVKANIIKLPFDSSDVLLIGKMGKNISGSGMDTKVIGRIMVRGQEEPALPNISTIVVLGLTSESHGNAVGIGLADITTERVFKSVDLFITAENAIYSLSPAQGRMPCIVKDDRKAIECALITLGKVVPSEVKLAYIDNTLQLETMAVSEALLENIKLAGGNIEVIGGSEEFVFDEEGNLLNFRGGLARS